ncbi:MAG: DUF4172 domain-containing protein [Cyclobacteriaceae bacterium]|nr:DUF4172 domain-containing protein [Cyclobacteriaceae bacterium]
MNVFKSSEMKGEALNFEQVRSSIARRIRDGICSL